MKKLLVAGSDTGREYRPLVAILLVLTMVYFPFVDKAFTIDDTLFLKAAEQILISPADFYRGEVNWYGRPSAQDIINKNPPLVSYMIAGVAWFFGFNEYALHTFFFLVLLLASIGIYSLATHLASHPLIAASLAVFTPVVLIHGTNVMTDSGLLMFSAFAVLFWFKGIKAMRGSGSCWQVCSWPWDH